MKTQNKTIGENYALKKLKEFGYKRINIKTSAIRIERIKETNYERKFWSFKNEKDRVNDFDLYILVCLDEKNKVEKTFIIPSKIIGRRDLITIPRKSNRDYYLKGYEDKWELIK